MKAMGYDQTTKFIEKVMEMTFGASELLVVNDTYQFEDYSNIVATRFDPVEKARIRDEQFPNDCKKAFDMGVRFSKKIIANSW